MARTKTPAPPDARDLDGLLRPLRDMEPLGMPGTGWLRAVRTALGISAADLGRLLGMSRQAVADLERREVQGTVTMAGLRRAAEALDCRLMYAVVPRKSLKKMRKARARAANSPCPDGDAGRLGGPGL